MDDGLFSALFEEAPAAPAPRWVLESADDAEAATIIKPVDAPSVLTVGKDQTLHGTGTFATDLIVEGTYAPGNSPGVTTQDSLTLTGSSVLEIELGGLNPGTGDGFHDQIRVNGPVTLAGRLDVSLWSGYAPTAADVGKSYTIITSTGAITGDFASFDGLTLGNNLHLSSRIDGNATDGYSYKLEVVQGPVRPLIFVPGFGGSFPVSSALATWITNRGLSPSQLQLEPVTNAYDSLIQSLTKAGYELGKTLFVANWDWRMAVAPTDGTVDGALTGITAAQLVDNTFTTGLDYLGYALKQAAQVWASTHGGAAPVVVDMITHSTGGLVARSYIQSSAYGESYGAGELPEVNDLFQIGVPSQGVVQAFNFLADNFGLSSSSRLAGLFANIAYQHVLGGGTVTGPDGNITLDSIKTAGSADPVKFLRAYLPSLVDLTATFDFLDIDPTTNPAAFVDVNSSPTTSLLLDLNDGLGLDTATNVDANAFIDRLRGDLSIIYSAELSSPSQLQATVGGLGPVVGMTSPAGRTPGSSETWYQQLRSTTGDGTVLATSAWGQFATETNAARLAKLHQVLLTAAGSGGAVDHTSLVFNSAALAHILSRLGAAGPGSPALVNDGQRDTAGQAAALLSYTFGFFLSQVRSVEDAFAIFDTALTAVRGILSDLNSAATSTGFNVPAFSVALPDVTLDGVLALTAPVISLSGPLAGGAPRYSSSAGFTGTITLGASTATLFPGGAFSASLTDSNDADNLAVTGTYDFASRSFSYTLDAFSLTIGSDIQLSATAGSAALDVLNPDAFSVSLLDASLAVGGVSIAGNFALSRGTGDEFSLSASNLNAAIVSGASTLSLANARLGARFDLDSGKYAFALRGGVSLTGVSALALSGTFLAKRSTFAGTASDTFAFGTVATPDDIVVAGGLRSFSGTGLSLTVGQFITVTGDLAFDVVSSELRAVGSNLSATAALGNFSVGFTTGDLALRVGSNGTLVLAASATGLVLNGSGFASATATAITLHYNNTGAAVSGDSIEIGSVTRTLTVDSGTADNPFLALTATGVTASFGGLITLNGNFVFTRASSASGATTYRAAVTGLGFAFGTGSTNFVTVSGGTGAFFITAAGTAASFNVTASISGVSGLSMPASTFRFEVNTSAQPFADTITVAGTPVSVDLSAGTFLRLVAAPVTVTVGGLALTGRVAYEQTTRDSGDKITLLQLADVSASFNGAGTDSATIAITNARGFFVLNAAGAAGSLAFTAGASFGVFTAGAAIRLEVNRTGSAVSAAGAFGSVSMEAGTYTRVAVNNLVVVLPGVEIEGDFSFRTALIDGVITNVIVGNNVRLFFGNNTGGVRAGFELTDGQAVFIRTGATTEVGFVTGRVRMIGVAGFDLDATMTVRVNESTAAVSESFTLDDETIDLEFADDEVAAGGASFVQVRADAVRLSLAGFAVLQGNFVFTRSGQEIVAAGTDVVVFAGTRFGESGETGLKLTNGLFAIRVDLASGRFVAGVRGSASLVGTPGASFAGTLTLIVNRFATSQTVVAGVGSDVVVLEASASTTYLTGTAPQPRRLRGRVGQLHFPLLARHRRLDRNHRGRRELFRDRGDSRLLRRRRGTAHRLRHARPRLRHVPHYLFRPDHRRHHAQSRQPRRHGRADPRGARKSVQPRPWRHRRHLRRHPRHRSACLPRPLHRHARRHECRRARRHRGHRRHAGLPSLDNLARRPEGHLHLPAWRHRPDRCAHPLRLRVRHHRGLSPESSPCHTRAFVRFDAHRGIARFRRLSRHRRRFLGRPVRCSSFGHHHAAHAGHLRNARDHRWRRSQRGARHHAGEPLAKIVRHLPPDDERPDQRLHPLRRQSSRDERRASSGRNRGLYLRRRRQCARGL